MVLQHPAAALTFSWTVTRSAPLETARSGPTCRSSAVVMLADATRQDLLAVLDGDKEAAEVLAEQVSHHSHYSAFPQQRSAFPGMLHRPAASADSRQLTTGFNIDCREQPETEECRPLGSKVSASPQEQNVTNRLYPLFWRLQGDQCDMEPETLASSPSGSSAVGSGSNWTDQAVGCNVSLLHWGRLASSSAMSAVGAGWKRQADKVEAADSWWRLNCTILDTAGQPIDFKAQPEKSSCGKDAAGPPVVAILGRVQSGLIGATLSSFGITGLYITFVLGIGRFLRLWVANMRLKIPFEDFPSTQRLVALCQDIYIARAEGELLLEAELFALLIKIYKSPALRQELTK